MYPRALNDSVVLPILQVRHWLPNDGICFHPRSRKRGCRFEEMAIVYGFKQGSDEFLQKYETIWHTISVWAAVPNIIYMHWRW